MFAWVLVIILAVWLITKYSKHQAVAHSSGEIVVSDKDEPISEEVVYEAQNNFEKKFEETFLPDSLSGKDIYIYLNLMNKWFYELSAKNRYDDGMVQKLRRDFLDYMYSTSHGRTANYLSFELDDKAAQDSYSEEAMTHGRKTYTIENAFAALIGNEAEKELARVRELDYSAIDKNGNLAPEGHHFDLIGNLKPNKKERATS